MFLVPKSSWEKKKSEKTIVLFPFHCLLFWMWVNVNVKSTKMETKMVCVNHRKMFFFSFFFSHNLFCFEKKDYIQDQENFDRSTRDKLIRNGKRTKITGGCSTWISICLDTATYNKLCSCGKSFETRERNKMTSCPKLKLSQKRSETREKGAAERNSHENDGFASIKDTLSFLKFFKKGNKALSVLEHSNYHLIKTAKPEWICIGYGIYKNSYMKKIMTQKLDWETRSSWRKVGVSWSHEVHAINSGAYSHTAVVGYVSAWAYKLIVNILWLWDAYYFDRKKEKQRIN